MDVTQHQQSLRAFVNQRLTEHDRPTAEPEAPQRVRPTGDLYRPVIPAGAADVTRRSREFGRRWGNPYVVGRTVTVDREPVEVRNRAHAVNLYRAYLRRHPELVQLARRELAGRDLACWCPLPDCGEDDICHAAVLLQVAAGGEP